MDGNNVSGKWDRKIEHVGVIEAYDQAMLSIACNNGAANFRLSDPVEKLSDGFFVKQDESYHDDAIDEEHGSWRELVILHINRYAVHEQNEEHGCKPSDKADRMFSIFGFAKSSSDFFVKHAEIYP
jgi:hypothetical protein